MERLYYIARDHITRFKLDYCCWFAPVRVGLMAIGYFHILFDVICLIGIANDGMSPTITKVMEMLIEDNVSKPVPVLTYCTEVAFNVVLLCALHRRDLMLLRVFLYYTILAVIISVMMYSIIISAVPFHIQVAIVASVVFQSYSILIIRSVMVEFRLQGKKKELPVLVMSSLLNREPTPCIYNPNNGKLQEVVISEVPKTQQALIPAIEYVENDTKEFKLPEFKKVLPVKFDKVKRSKEVKKDPEVIVQVENKDDKDVIKEDKKNEDIKKAEIKKEDVKIEVKKEDVKIEVKKIDDKSKENDEDKTKDDKKSEEDKKKEDKKIQEERKKEEKKLKEEKKKEEKKLKEEKKKEEKKIKEEKKKDEKKFTSLILKKYKEDKEAKANEQEKDTKDVSLQTVKEDPKE